MAINTIKFSFEGTLDEVTAQLGVLFKEPGKIKIQGEAVLNAPTAQDEKISPPRWRWTLGLVAKNNPSKGVKEERIGVDEWDLCGF